MVASEDNNKILWVFKDRFSINIKACVVSTLTELGTNEIFQLVARNVTYTCGHSCDT